MRAQPRFGARSSRRIARGRGRPVLDVAYKLGACPVSSRFFVTTPSGDEAESHACHCVRSWAATEPGRKNQTPVPRESRLIPLRTACRRPPVSCTCQGRTRSGLSDCAARRMQQTRRKLSRASAARMSLGPGRGQGFLGRPTLDRECRLRRRHSPACVSAAAPYPAEGPWRRCGEPDHREFVGELAPRPRASIACHDVVES